MIKNITLFSLFNVLIIGELCAQSLTYLVRVKDKLNEKVIENASIIINDSVLTSSNYLGYAQFQALVGDTIIITKSDYETVVIALPTQLKISVNLIIEEKKLLYSGGISSFYRNLQRAIKYPKLLRDNSVQTQIYVELRVDSLGGTEVVKVHNDYKGVFNKEFTKIFKKMNGRWDLFYENKTFILPVKYIIRQLPQTNHAKRLSAEYDMMLSEVVVTAYRL